MMADIRVPDDLWQTSIMPEGILERWLVPNGTIVAQGQPVAMIRVGDNLHEIAAPSGGQLTAIADASSMVEPGSLIAQLSS
jgi:biotin carboxyl carrier protein